MMLTDLVKQYPPEKRGKPEQRFVYRTH